MFTCLKVSDNHLHYKNISLKGILNILKLLFPLKELLLAEKWARMNKLPFPKIDPHVFDREGLKECYVFHPKNPSIEKDCPTVIHFVLANIAFRKFKAPGTCKEEYR